MFNINQIDYSPFDRPEILRFLFHPRSDSFFSSPNPKAINLDIPVSNNNTIGATMHPANPDYPTILFFHGNGEIVSDYDELGPIYNNLGINFFPVDYRGYGRSTGSPTVTTMMQDCHLIFDYVIHWLDKNKYNDEIIVMGRSLGSASAIELAYHHQSDFSGLIIESGFAYATPLLRLLGINIERFGLSEAQGFQNIDKIKAFHKPTLIIHAQYDHIIPHSDGQALYDSCPAPLKEILTIRDADHNSIFSIGLDQYMTAVKKLIGKIINLE